MPFRRLVNLLLFAIKPKPRGVLNLQLRTKVKNTRLADSDHNIDCKIEGFGAMALKSELVKKA